jgi:hypothetical protein
MADIDAEYLSRASVHAGALPAQMTSPSRLGIVPWEQCGSTQIRSFDP